MKHSLGISNFLEGLTLPETDSGSESGLQLEENWKSWV